MKQLLIVMLALIGTTQAAERPNIIVIYTDDQGFGDASCLNPNAKSQTPNLDRLSTEGIAFTNAHCAWASNGKIPMHRNPANGYRLFLRSELEDFLEEVRKPVNVERASA